MFRFTWLFSRNRSLLLLLLLFIGFIRNLHTRQPPQRPLAAERPLSRCVGPWLALAPALLPSLMLRRCCVFRGWSA